MSTIIIINGRAIAVLGHIANMSLRLKAEQAKSMQAMIDALSDALEAQCANYGIPMPHDHEHKEKDGEHHG